MTMKLLGLAGHAGAGKDYTYAALRANLEPGVIVERVAFADGLKFDIEEALEVGPFDLPALRDKPYSPEIRSLLQWWGTELRRDQYGDDYWIRKGMEMVREADQWADLVVITDVRFQNEADAVREAGGMVVGIVAPRSVREDRIGKLPPQHASEEIDFEIDAFIDSQAKGGIAIPSSVHEYIDGHLGLWTIYAE
jgi:hypothetical protein